jgi:hypothetical protein
VRIPLFAWPYKVKPASSTSPWLGYRLWWMGLDVLEPCEFYRDFAAGSLGPDARYDEMTEEEFDRDDEPVLCARLDCAKEHYWYPLCDPANPCECCAKVRARGEHTHTGIVRGSFPFGRDRWRKHWWNRKRWGSAPGWSWAPFLRGVTIGVFIGLAIYELVLAVHGLLR